MLRHTSLLGIKYFAILVSIFLTPQVQVLLPPCPLVRTGRGYLPLDHYLYFRFGLNSFKYLGIHGFQKMFKYHIFFIGTCQTGPQSYPPGRINTVRSLLTEKSTPILRAPVPYPNLSVVERISNKVGQHRLANELGVVFHPFLVSFRPPQFRFLGHSSSPCPGTLAFE